MGFGPICLWYGEVILKLNLEVNNYRSYSLLKSFLGPLIFLSGLSATNLLVGKCGPLDLSPSLLGAKSRLGPLSLPKLLRGPRSPPKSRLGAKLLPPPFLSPPNPPLLSAFGLSVAGSILMDKLILCISSTSLTLTLTLSPIFTLL